VGDGQANDVTITDGAGPLDYVIDDVVPIEAGEGCAHPGGGDLTLVVCSLAPEDEGQGWFDISLGDMNDSIDAGSTAGGEVYGGPSTTRRPRTDEALRLEGPRGHSLPDPVNERLSWRNPPSEELSPMRASRRIEYGVGRGPLR
jgi:hypothetical protein